MAFEVLENKKYDILDPLVEDIHKKCIRMDPEEKQALVERFNRVMEKFIPTMKEVDPLFREVYNRNVYTGSYYDGLRVKEATEYDVNLILKPDLEIIVDTVGCNAGFISVEFNKTYDKLPKAYKQWVKPYTTLLKPNSVSSWLQGVVQRTFTKIDDSGYWFDDCEIEAVKSGPAWTLLVIPFKDPMKIIHIDLVPVLEFIDCEWPVPRQMLGVECSDTWFAVPKPPRNGCSTEWRLSFPIQETAMMKGLKYLKYTLRLLKRVRDQFQFKAIASYYITTLFLWEIIFQDKSIWVTTRRGRLFIYMLIRLKEALEKENIPFLWDEDCNLIEHISSDCLENFCGRLKRFLKKIDFLIDSGEHEKLKLYIRNKLNTSEEVIGEKEFKVQAAREQATRVQAAREQATRVQAAREQATRETNCIMLLLLLLLLFAIMILHV